jgi:hypothetical protein
MLKTRGDGVSSHYENYIFNPLNTQLNPICHLLALLEAHHILHVSRIRENYLLFTLLQNDVCDETVDRQPVSLKNKRCKFLMSCFRAS